MINVFKNSLLFRFFEKVVEIYKNGAIHKATVNTKKYYEISRTKVALDNYASKESAVNTSFYQKIVNLIASFLTAIGNVYAHSFVKKIFDFFVNLYMNITKNSKIFKPIHALGVKGALIFLFAMYLFLDFVFGDLIYIPVISSTWDELLLILFFVVVIYRHITFKTDIRLKTTPLDGYLFMYFCVGLFLMVYVSPIMYIAIEGYRQVFQYMLWFFAIILLIDDDKDFKVLYNSFIAIAIPVCLHGLYQFVTNAPMPSNWVTSTENFSGTRIYSILGSPNIMGAFLVLFAPLIAGYLYTAKTGIGKFLALGFTGGMCLAVLLTYSKGAWIGLAVAVLLFAILVDKRLLALILAGATFVVAFIPDVSNRITYLFTEEYQTASDAGGRSMRWAFGFDLLEENNPLLGFGLGRFGGATAMRNQVLLEIDGFEYFYLDNYYLKTLVEMGYLGLSFYILLLIAFIFVSIKAILRVRNTEMYVPTVSIFCGMMGVLAHCFTENIFEVPYMQAYFWAMAGLIMYVGFVRNRKKLK